MPNNENNFTHDGVEYVAVEGNVLAGCTGCDLLFKACDEVNFASCTLADRTDGREVIFKKKVNLEKDK